ncbi:hypothetical protein HUU39_12410 [candidate division KSB1 bacterium]|nr:hypothetical protein [bacterium]NUM66063.1 hypothetical protein [candidate division KSB1 bacterium]
MKRLTIVNWLLALMFLAACTKETETPPGSTSQPPAVAKTPEQKLEDVRADIKALKTELAQAGKYFCCIQEPCNFCLLHEGSCPCLHELESGEHVCVECYTGWQQDKGIVKGIKKEQVTTSFVKHEHKH